MNQVATKILNDIQDYYMKSNDFNGYPVDKEFLINFRVQIEELISSEKVLIYFDPENPHILRFPPYSIKRQIEWIEETLKDNESAIYCCLYPTKKHLKQIVNNNKYSNRPYERKMLLGNAQLEPIFFEPKVLLEYREDPRYVLSINGCSGSIDFRDRDSSFIQTFGFGIKKPKAPYEISVAVFTRYLADLSPTEQQRWLRFEIEKQEEYLLHPDYAEMSMGSWDFKVSMYTAFLEEIKLINEISQKVFGTCFFIDTYDQNSLKQFSYILLPTLSEYNSFAQVLNNIFIDNINKDFFKAFKFKDFESKRTLELLEEWINTNFTLEDKEPVENMLRTIRQKIRSIASHKEKANDYNIKYFEEQRKLMSLSYVAINTLRQIMELTIQDENVKVSSWLRDGKVSRY